MKTTPSRMAGILEGAIVKAQLDHCFPKSIKDNISPPEYGFLLIVTAFLATYGVISALRKTLLEDEAEKIAQIVKETEMGRIASNSGMTKEKWMEMYEEISIKLDDAINNYLPPEQQIIDLGLLMLSHSSIEKEYFAKSLVLECGRFGFRVLKTATIETHSQLSKHEFVWDDEPERTEGPVAKADIDKYKMAVRKELINDIEINIPDSIRLLLDSVGKRADERPNYDKLFYEFLYLTIYSYVNANSVLFSRDQELELLDILEEITEELLSPRMSEQELCDRMIDLNYRLREYDRGLRELKKDSASRQSQAVFYQLFIERIFGAKYNNDLMITMQLPIIYGIRRITLIDYFKGIEGIWQKET